MSEPYISHDDRWGTMTARFDSRLEAIESAMDMFEEPDRDEHGEVTGFFHPMTAGEAEAFVNETEARP